MLMLLLLLLWLCDVGTAAVTAARACPAVIGVDRSSYLTSLKGVPQSCEMGRDMSSSSSSIQRLSGKLPGETGRGHKMEILDWDEKYCVWKSFGSVNTVHDSYLCVYDLWLIGNLGVICFKTKQKKAKYHPVISGNFALWQKENYLTLSM